MLSCQVLLRLKPMVNNPLIHRAELYSRVLRFFGDGESVEVTILAEMIDQQSDPTIAPPSKRRAK